MSKFIAFTFIAGGLFLFTNCGDPAQVVKTSTKTERIPVEITENDLFKGNVVMAFLENEIKFIQESNELFLKGLNAYRNNDDLDSADIYFKESIYKEPTAKAYFELGNVYMDKKDYEAALLAYGVAEQLDYEPFSKILYNKACLYSLEEKEDMSGKYLEYAIQAGYNNLAHIEKDKDLEFLRKRGYTYNKAIERGLRGVSNAENLFWLQFKKQFSTIKLPTTLTIAMDDEMSKSLKYISYDYEKYISEMRDGKFSREVSKGFFYYTRPYENENFVALVYIEKEEFLGPYAPLVYKLATFTHEGKLIDKQIIGGTSHLDEPILVATMNKNMTIDCKIVEPIYEKDPDDEGYYDNKIVDTQELGTQQFEITSKGKIIVSEPQLASAE